jgi:hypothetical protein
MPLLGCRHKPLASNRDRKDSGGTADRVVVIVDRAMGCH